MEALQDSIKDVKQSISAKNADKFENCVEVHMKHIQSGLSQMGNLHAFMKSNASTPTKNSTTASKVVKKAVADKGSDGEDDDSDSNDMEPKNSLNPLALSTEESVA